MIAVQCEQCDRRFVADDEQAGTKVRCDRCKAWVRVPKSVQVKASKNVEGAARFIRWFFVTCLVVAGVVLLLLLSPLILRMFFR